MFPSRSDLRGVNLAGEDLTGIRLVEADLAEAELSGADLSVAELDGVAHMGGARLVGATLVEANLEAVVAARTDFTLAAAMRCHCVDADFTDAVLRQSSWLDANWNAADLDGADLTACVIAGGSGFPEELLHSGATAATRLVLTSGHAGPVGDVAWEPNGRLLASAGDDGSVYLWNLASKHELACFRGHAGPVNCWHGSPQSSSSVGVRTAASAPGTLRHGRGCRTLASRVAGADARRDGDERRPSTGCRRKRTSRSGWRKRASAGLAVGRSATGYRRPGPNGGECLPTSPRADQRTSGRREGDWQSRP